MTLSTDIDFNGSFAFTSVDVARHAAVDAKAAAARLRHASPIPKDANAYDILTILFGDNVEGGPETEFIVNGHTRWGALEESLLTAIAPHVRAGGQIDYTDGLGYFWTERFTGTAIQAYEGHRTYIVDGLTEEETRGREAAIAITRDVLRERFDAAVVDELVTTVRTRLTTGAQAIGDVA